MYSLTKEVKKFENAVTKVTEIAITIDGYTNEVIANAEQTPRIWTVIGLISIKGSNNNFFSLGPKKGSFS
jgi:hypothetical protein